MSKMYDSGLHPVEKALPNPYSDLPQVYQPQDAAETAPQVMLKKEYNHHDAPEVVSAPPMYDAGLEGPNISHIDQNEKGLEDTPRSERQILGIKRKTALIVGIIAIIAILAIAVGVGAGVGTSRRDRSIKVPDANSDSVNSTMSSTVVITSTTTATTTTKHISSTTTSTPVATSGFQGTAEVKCPSINNTEINSGNSRFQVRCAVHWPNNSPAENNNGTVKAVGGNKLAAYTLEECLQHCVDYNQQNGGADPIENGSGCLAVTYNADLTASFAKYGQNCFLKDRAGVYDPAADTTESAVLVSV